MNISELIAKLDPYVKEVCPAKLITISFPISAVFSFCFSALIWDEKGYRWFGSSNDLKKVAIEFYKKRFEELKKEFSLEEKEKEIIKHIREIPKWKNLTDEELIKEAEKTCKILKEWWDKLGVTEGIKYTDIEVFVDPFIKEKNLGAEEIVLFKESLHLEEMGRDNKRDLQLIEFIKRVNEGISEEEFTERLYLNPKYTGYDRYELYTRKELESIDINKLKKDLEKRRKINPDNALKKLKQKVKITPEEEEKIKITRLASYLLDERRYFANLLNMGLFILVEEFSRRMNSPQEEFWKLNREEFIRKIKGEAVELTFPKMILGYDAKEVANGENARKTFKEIEEKLENISKIEKTLQGFGASKGTVEGIVRIILNPHEEELQNGEILVTYFTQPEYVPLMRKARGIITECGGVTSHAAIVSRELGVPCIVGVKNAVIHLRNGQKIKMDGAKGIVEILE